MNLYDTLLAKALSGSGGGGGGGERLSLIHSQQLENINITATAGTDTGYTYTIDLDVARQYGLIMFVFTANTKGNNKHWASLGFTYTRDTGGLFIIGDSINYYVDSSGNFVNACNSSTYGLYVSSGEITATEQTLKVYGKYSQYYSKEINNNYTMDVYGLHVLDLLKLE